MGWPFVKKALVWGFLLWLFGYALGIAFFLFVPQSWLGWTIMPFGIAATLWVLWKKIPSASLRDYALVGLMWAVTAILCDYVFLVMFFQPADGYYKLDVYIYYALTFLLPIFFGLWKHRRGSTNTA